MLLSPRSDTTCADLLRAVAFWLVLVLVLQGQVAALAGLRGPLHNHRATGLPSDAGHRHDTGHAERHHHGADDASVAEAVAAEDALDAVAAALAAAFALLAFHLLRHRGVSVPRLWQARPGWASVPAPPAPLLKPPQAG